MELHVAILSSVWLCAPLDKPGRLGKTLGKREREREREREKRERERKGREREKKGGGERREGTREREIQSQRDGRRGLVSVVS